MENPRVLISMVTMNDAIYTPTVQSIMKLDLAGIDVEWHWATHSITAAARNCSAAKAVGENFDYLVFLDLDQTFHPSTIRRLIGHNVDIVSGMYRARRGDPSPFFAFHIGDDGMPRTLGVVDMTGPELIEVDALPTGCLCIKTEVFRTLDRVAAERGEPGPAPGQPYFYYESRLDRVSRRLEEQMREAAMKGDVDVDVLRFKPAFCRGEDIRFCVSAKEAGCKLWLDTRLTCGHLAVQSYGHPALYTGGV